MDPEQKADTQFEFDTITIGSGVSSGETYQYNYSIDSSSIDLSSLNTMSQGLTIANGGMGANIIGGAIGSGIYTTTTNGTSGYNWNIASPSTTVSQAGHLSLQGKDADIDINGRSMSDWMTKVEERLNIMTPNPELEQEWDELRRLGERYRKLEKKCREKSEMWQKLKSMTPPKVLK